MENLLKLEDIYYLKGKGNHLMGVNLELFQGDRIIIFPDSYGPAATLIKICATIEEPEKGKVSIFGKRVDFSNEDYLYDLRKRIAMVNHESVLISNLTLFENIALFLWYHQNRKLKDLEGEIMEILIRLGLEADRYRRPSGIDHFRRRRAIYAMELIKNPRLVLLDQPFRDFPSYDLHYFEEVINIATSDLSRGILIVTQNREFIKRWARSVIVLENGIAKQLKELSEIENNEERF
jgi:ABC-type transporter Mla maintaining outer membrane lipid asymmetry ATPase subunit MlaF